MLRFALSDFNGKMNIYLDQKEWNQGSFTPINTRDRPPNATVDVTTGDQLIRDLKISRLDLIKINGEGFEFPALKGLDHSIGKFLPGLFLDTTQIIGNQTALFRIAITA